MYTECRNVYSQTSWGDRGDQNKDLLSKKYIYICRRCVLAALRTVRLGLTKIGNQPIPLKYSEKKKIVFRTNLKQMFKVRPPTSKHTRQRRIGDWRMRSKMPGYCLNNTCNKIGFRINWRRVNQGLIVAPQEEVSLCELRWSGGPNHWPAPSNPAIVYKWRWGVPSSAKTHLRHTVPRQ